MTQSSPIYRMMYKYKDTNMVAISFDYTSFLSLRDSPIIVN